jgi:hypothetical protein
LCCSSAAVAADRGSVTGTISDKTGAVLAGATVKITNSTGFSQSVVTNDQGAYALTGLPAGTYHLAISATGFKAFETDGLAVADGQSIPFDVSLEPATVTSTVSVESVKAAQVETENAEVSGTITQKEMIKIGLNGRNFSQLIALTPGVSNQTGQDEAKVGIVGSVKYSVNGGRVEYNSFDVDGGDVLNTGISASRGQVTLIVYPSLDAISELKVLTSNYGAQYGRSASGTVLVKTKSGTKAFHGNGYEFIRNEFFNARNFFDHTSKAPLYRRNDFGYTLGGPVFIPKHYNSNKDKTFFFFSQEFRFEKTPTPFNQAVPSAAERQGDFSDVCPVAFDGTVTFTPTFSRKAFPDCPQSGPSSTSNGVVGFRGNVVPIDSVAQAILDSNIIPAPNATTGCNSTIGSCYDTDVSPSTSWREELFRIDHTFNSKWQANFRYIHDAWDTTVVTPQWDFVQNRFPSVQNRFIGPGLSLVANFTTIISPSFLNNLVLSYTTDHITLTNQGGSGVNLQRPASLDSPCITNPITLKVTNCPIGYLFKNGFGGKMPGIVIAGTNAAYGGNGFAADTSYMPWQHSNPTYSVHDDITKVIGKHSLQFGVQAVQAQQNEVSGAVGANTGDVQGLLTFSNQSSAFTSFNAFADFLRGGNTKTFQQDSAQGKYYNYYTIVEPYVQDDWRVTPRLTVNLGFRASLFGTWQQKFGRAYNWERGAFDPALAAQASVNSFFGVLQDSLSGQPIRVDLNNLDPRITNGLVQCGKGSVPSSCMKGHLFNSAPRVGFAWDPTGSSKTSIRGGYGIFFEHGTGDEANTGSLIGSAPLVLDMVQNHPSSYTCIGGVGRDCGGAGAYPLNVTSIPTKVVWPYVQQWSLGVERELPSNLVASVAYVGNKGTHLSTQLQLNQLHPLPGVLNPFGLSDPITADVCSSYDGAHITVGNTIITSQQPAFLNLLAACFGSKTSKFFPDPNSLRQFAPGFGRILSLENIADSSYHALQVTFRRTQGPLNLGVSYSYAHSIDDSSDRSDATFVNSFDLRSNRASSNFDQRHLFSFSFVYDLPLAHALSMLRQYGTYNPDAPPVSSRIAHFLLDGWQVSGVAIHQSGTPFSVINGGSSTGVSVLDNAGVANGTGAGSYPDVVGDPTTRPPDGGHNALSFGPLLLNPNAFAAPRGLTFGTAGRNFLRNPGRTNLDMALLKQFHVFGERTIEVRMEAFNVFNHTQFRIYDPDLGNTGSNIISCYGGPNNSAGFVDSNSRGTNCLLGNSFLHPVDAHRPRTMQFGVKYAF